MNDQSSTSSLDKTIGLAEIRRLVFEQIDDPATLAACLRTCHLWSEEVVPILWRGKPDPFSAAFPGAEDLEQLARSPKRFEHYIQHVQHLDLRPRTMGNPELRKLWNADIWRKARYRSLTVDLGTAQMTESNMKPLLQPRLLVLELYGGYYTDSFLSVLQDRCPRLRFLLVDNHSDKISSRALLQALKSFKNLEGIEFETGFELCMSEPVLVEIANIVKLRHLSLGDFTSINRDIMAASSHKLRNLRSLKLQWTPEVDLRDMIGHMCCLEKFDLQLPGPHPQLQLESHVLVPLSNCRKLQELSIFDSKAWAPSKDTFEVFTKNCKSLKVFELTQNDTISSQEPRNTWILEVIARNLLELEELTYEHPCTMTKAELAALANCTHLRYLDVKAPLVLEDLQNTPDNAVFSRLERISVECLGIPARAWAGDIVLIEADAIYEAERVFETKMPHVASISVHDPDLMTDRALRHINAYFSLNYVSETVTYHAKMLREILSRPS